MKRPVLAACSIVALGLGFTAASHAQGMGSSGSGAMSGTQSRSQSQSQSQSPSRSQASHDDVKQVQEKLQQEGLYHGPIDGMAGPETKQALAQFQQKHGLKQTGTLDRETLAALNASSTTGMGSSTPGSTPGATTPPSSGYQGGGSPSQQGQQGQQQRR